MQPKWLMPLLAVSLLANIFFLTVAFLYYRTSAFDYGVVQRGIPKLCRTMDQQGGAAKQELFYQRSCLGDEVDGRYP